MRQEAISGRAAEASACHVWLRRVRSKFLRNLARISQEDKEIGPVFAKTGPKTRRLDVALQDFAQFSEEFVDVVLLDDQRRRERDDIAGRADQQALFIGL